ncbi:DUF930 domain-containing protein [uncultured Alsobacter sp.]|uniref:DUF930 domain-containing protein n=1 Tax=uncultured Alsobacter sp. TaxID=1748258 RepID=UPI0025D118FF|nr:DUF930 domain-containing protein [uncultured Alsobacter sp.]
MPSGGVSLHVPRRPPQAPWGLAASLALHVCLAAALLSEIVQAPQPPDFADEVPVEVLTAQQFDAMTRPPAPPPALPAPETLPPPPASAPAETVPGFTAPAVAAPPAFGARVHATTVLSTAVLDSPRSRRTREKLARVDLTTRLEQICGIEALAQIAGLRAGYQPTNVVAYALGDVRADGDAIVAPGAAFLSVHRWYRLDFRCRLARGTQRVAAFDFAVGPEIPRREWESHGLTDHAAMDD